MVVRIVLILSFFFTVYLTVSYAETETLYNSALRRLELDIQKNKPVVVHVNVALADNKNQWIVKVPKILGNGHDPANNLYWGAMYGVKTYLRKAGWKLLNKEQFINGEILERIVFFKKIKRKGVAVPVYLIADAWDGAHIDDAINRFLSMVSGEFEQTIKYREFSIIAGAQSHLVVYIGHNLRLDPTVFGFNGLMNIKRESYSIQTDNPHKGAIVLACQSHDHFSEELKKHHVFPLLTTTGNMAPEAYTLHAVIMSWVRGFDPLRVRFAAADAYRKYQNIGIRAARSLFTNGFQQGEQ